jgi:hypothetical protein
VVNKLFLKYLRNYKINNVKTISGTAESTDLIFKYLKYNPISGETVPLMWVGYLIL